MPSFDTLFALIACSALAGQTSEPRDACGPAPEPSIQCEVTGFPACFNPHGDDGMTISALPKLDGEPSPTVSALPKLDGEPAPTPLTESVSWARGRTETYIPAGFWSSDGKYDLLLHFHGAPSRVETAFQASDFDHTVLVTVNLGVGSGPYENRFAAPAAFPQLLDSIQRAVAQRAPTKNLRLGRVALSGWSAGYGAIKQILTQAEHRSRVDAVLLADGLHAGFVNPTQRIIYAPKLAPFVAFAEEATQGTKLMVVAHSSIRTTGYASTTETARHLLRSVGLQPHPIKDQQVHGMALTSSVEKRGFHVQGYAGADARAHVDHLAHIDGTLLRQLSAWWTRPAERTAAR
jgi:hypothetical protein